MPVTHSTASDVRVLDISCGSSILYFSKSSKTSLWDNTSAFQFYKQRYCWISKKFQHDTIDFLLKHTYKGSILVFGIFTLIMPNYEGEWNASSISRMDIPALKNNLTLTPHATSFLVILWKSATSITMSKNSTAHSPRSRRHQAAAASHILSSRSQSNLRDWVDTASHIHTDSSQSYLQWRRRL